MTVKPTFAVGDTVILKGQTQALTVIDQPQSAMSQEGWTWVAYANTTGISLTLLPIAALRKIDRARLK